MRRPQPPGEIGKALTPIVEELARLEERALRGDAMPVVELSKHLSAAFLAAGREAMERLLDQAARAQLGPVPCPSCAQPAESKGFEGTSFIGRFGRVPVSRRRFTCCGQSWFPIDLESARFSSRGVPFWGHSSRTCLRLISQISSDAATHSSMSC